MQRREKAQALDTLSTAYGGDDGCQHRRDLQYVEQLGRAFNARPACAGAVSSWYGFTETLCLICLKTSAATRLSMFFFVHSL